MHQITFYSNLAKIRCREDKCATFIQKEIGDLKQLCQKEYIYYWFIIVYYCDISCFIELLWQFRLSLKRVRHIADSTYTSTNNKSI
jgi:hypothetical protein